MSVILEGYRPSGIYVIPGLKREVKSSAPQAKTRDHLCLLPEMDKPREITQEITDNASRLMSALSKWKKTPTDTLLEAQNLAFNALYDKISDLGREKEAGEASKRGWKNGVKFETLRGKTEAECKQSEICKDFALSEVWKLVQDQEGFENNHYELACELYRAGVFRSAPSLAEKNSGVVKETNERSNIIDFSKAKSKRNQQPIFPGPHAA